MMKKEYKLIGMGCLWGFMEGNVKSIEDSIKEKLKLEYDVEPEVVLITTAQPYNNDFYNATYPVITLSMSVDCLSWSIVRDCQSEAERSAIRAQTDPNWKVLWDDVSDEDFDRLTELINNDKI